ncbi:MULTISPECIES: ATP-binding protein [unclassified Mycobacterium]|uniref:ATP-binding protein n=1 Tax=unclassified Mycobacterium TaxID=2642494 RepID=UPI000AD7C4C4|nr:MULTISPECIES: ATP-binding protein [unclassified Mycobacterium]
MAACEQGRGARYITTAQLVTELVEAADERILSRVVAGYGRLDLLCLDEIGYVQIDSRGAELLFQIITEREDRAWVSIVTNLPFSEWGTVFRPAPGRRHRRPRHIQRPHHRHRHQVLPTTHQQNHHPRQTGRLGRRPTLRVRHGWAGRCRGNRSR